MNFHEWTSNSEELKLGLKLDYVGILRCYGRFFNAKIDENAKYSNLLPYREHFIRLLRK